MSTKAQKVLRQPDQFQEVGNKFLAWVLERSALLLGVGAAVLLAVVGAFALRSHLAHKANQASESLGEALGIASRPVAAQGGAGEQTFPTEEARRAAALAALQKVRAEHAGSAAALTALAQVGFLQLEGGDAAAAEKSLQQFLGEASKDHPLRAAATESLGYALEREGKLTEAAQAFGKLADEGSPARAAYQKARLETVAKNPQAKQDLAKVSKDFPKDGAAMEANLRLEVASLPDAAPEPAPATKPEKPAAHRTARK